MVLGFIRHDMGEMDFPSPAAISDRHVNLREARYLSISAVSSTCITPLIKSSIICESLWYWGLRFGVFSSIIMFLKRNIYVLVTHDLVVHLVSAVMLLENRDPNQPMPILWDSMESLS